MFTATWRRRAATIAAASAVVAMLLSGCSGGAEPEGTDAGTGRAESLVLGTSAPPNSFDLTTGADWSERAPFLQAVYDTILRGMPDGSVEPWVAEEFSYNDDNTVLTLQIRDGITFTDDTPLDASAVQQNLERIKNGSSSASSSLRSVESIAAPDAQTVVLTLSAPDPALVPNLARSAGLISSPAAFDSPNAATEPVGSGPYVLDLSATVGGTNYVFTANPDYWEPSVQHYDRLTVNVLADATATLNAVRAGEVNATMLADTKNLAEVEGMGWTLVPTTNSVWQGLLLLDRDGTMNPALGDVRVRQAINYAFDREGLVKALDGGNAEPTAQIFPTGSPAYDEKLDDAYPYDVEKAKELLAEAGYPNGFTLSMPNSTRLPAATWSLLQQQLADVGITVEYTDPGTNFLAELTRPSFPASWFRLGQDVDWINVNLSVTPDAQFNVFHTETDVSDELLERMQFGDVADQDAAATELNEYLVEQAWFAPWYRAAPNFVTDANTDVTETSASNGFPSIFDIRPKNN